MPTTLNWSGTEHWSPHRAPCTHCGAPTNLRTTDGRPAHKVCVEPAIDQLRRRHLKIVPDVNHDEEAVSS
jgi:hypothetical protein